MTQDLSWTASLLLIWGLVELHVLMHHLARRLTRFLLEWVNRR